MTVKLKNLLQNHLSCEELQVLVGGYDVVGDIAITIISPELEHRAQLIGETILRQNKKIKVVARRAGHYSGEYRTLPLEIIAGEDRKETEHCESGVRLLLNPEKVYYSVRSGTERKRIASLVQSGEEVLVLFSGIGPFPLVIARNSSAREIIGIEKNPEAHRYGLENLARNKKIRNVRLYQGDVDEVLARWMRKFDRIIMPLPKSAELFLAGALGVLRQGGWLHFYDLQQRDSFCLAQEKVQAACTVADRLLLTAAIVKCGHCAPRTYRICVDAQVN